MLAPKIVRQIRDLAGLKWGAKRIAAETGVARGTVRRYAPTRKPRNSVPRPSGAATSWRGCAHGRAARPPRQDERLKVALRQAPYCARDHESSSTRLETPARR
jgi:hypothetical protein